jgi:carbon monoxide dehydrogenase subunit G
MMPATVFYKMYTYPMHQITLRKQWTIKAPIEAVAKIMTDFKNMPKYFPEVAKSIHIHKQDGNHLEMEATVMSFGRRFKVKMTTQILPKRGFISDNDSYQFGTSGHEELLLFPKGDNDTLIDYTYQVTIHKAWLRVVATPLIKWYAMKAWEKSVIEQLKKLAER